MVIGCGSLSQVNDDEQHSKAVARPNRRRSSLHKRLRRKSGGVKGKFEKAFSRAVTDPLSLVGSELLVKGYSLAALENRLDNRNDGNGNGNGNGNVNGNNASTGGTTPTHYRSDDESSSECSRSEGTNASYDQSRTVDNGVGGILTISSYVSNENSLEQSIHNTNSHHAQLVRRKVLKKVHGKMQCSPLCPNCSENLAYRYISYEKQHLSVCDILGGTDSIAEKVQNLLPPLCKKCGTHLLFQHSKCKSLMMENFDTWLESGFDDDDSDIEEDYCNFNDPLNAKIMVVNDGTLEGNSSQALVVPNASPATRFFGDPRVEHSTTPRLSNTSRDSMGESSSRFKFDGHTPRLGKSFSLSEVTESTSWLECEDAAAADEAMVNGVFSGISELSEGTCRRKRLTVHVASNDNPRYGKSSRTEVTGSSSWLEYEHADEEHKSNSDSSSSEASSTVYSSDEDPFSLIDGGDDETTVFEPKMHDCNDGSDCSSTCGDTDQQSDVRVVKIVEIPPETSTLGQPLSVAEKQEILSKMALLPCGSGSGDEESCGSEGSYSDDESYDETVESEEDSSEDESDIETVESEAKYAAKDHYEKSNNDKRILMAMGIGLTNQDDTKFISYEHQVFKDAKMSSAIKPNNPMLVDELKRRQKAYDETNAGAIDGMTRAALIKALEDKPLTHENDVRFIKSQVQSLYLKCVALLASKKSKASESSTSQRCLGPAPCKRLSHSTIGVPESGFGTTANIHNGVHSDAVGPVDISCNDVLKIMDELTPEKAKDKKFMGMEAQSEQTGNGDEKDVDQDGFARQDDDVQAGEDADVTLLQFGNIIYKVVKENGVMTQAIQQTREGGAESEVHKREMTESNYQMAMMNETVLAKQLSQKEVAIYNCAKDIRKMKRSGDVDEEDILAETKWVEKLQTERDAITKRLDQMQHNNALIVYRAENVSETPQLLSTITNDLSSKPQGFGTHLVDSQRPAGSDE